jgi:histidine triad (HIT) family protein
MPNCLFCRIVKGEIAASIVHQDDSMVVFNDISPRAPFHVLIVPRRHIATLNDVGDGDVALIGDMIRLASRLAAEHGYAESGYRMVFNCNADAGQSVFHIHLHLLAGRHLDWPPG